MPRLTDALTPSRLIVVYGLAFRLPIAPRGSRAEPYSHLGTMRDRSEVVEYRVEQHVATLGDRLTALAGEIL